MPSRACGDDDAAQRAAVVYSLLATCKARGVDERAWLEDVLRRMPEYEPVKKDFSDLLPAKYKVNANQTDIKPTKSGMQLTSQLCRLHLTLLTISH